MPLLASRIDRNSGRLVGLIALVMRRSGVQIPEAAPCDVPGHPYRMFRDMFIFFWGRVALGHAAFAVSGAWSWFGAVELAVIVGIDGEFANEVAGPPGGEELADPWLGDPVEPRDFTLGLTRQDRFDDDSLLRHAATAGPSSDKHDAGHPINMS